VKEEDQEEVGAETGIPGYPRRLQEAEARDSKVNCRKKQTLGK